jgi:hypothetical protein
VLFAGITIVIIGVSTPATGAESLLKIFKNAAVPKLLFAQIDVIAPIPALTSVSLVDAVLLMFKYLSKYASYCVLIAINYPKM